MATITFEVYKILEKKLGEAEATIYSESNRLCCK